MEGVKSVTQLMAPSLIWRAHWGWGFGGGRWQIKRLVFQAKESYSEAVGNHTI